MKTFTASLRLRIVAPDLPTATKQLNEVVNCAEDLKWEVLEAATGELGRSRVADLADPETAKRFMAQAEQAA